MQEKNKVRLGISATLSLVAIILGVLTCRALHKDNPNRSDGNGSQVRQYHDANYSATHPASGYEANSRR